MCTDSADHEFEWGTVGRAWLCSTAQAPGEGKYTLPFDRSGKALEEHSRWKVLLWPVLENNLSQK